MSTHKEEETKPEGHPQEDFQEVDMWGVELFSLMISYTLGTLCSEKDKRKVSEEIYRWHKMH